MKEAGGGVKVAKNRLVKLALKNTEAEGIGFCWRVRPSRLFGRPDLRGQVSVKYAKENEKLVILGGAMGKSLLDTKAVQALAVLPTLDELSANLIGILKAPAAKIASPLEPGAKLARIMQAKGAKQQS